MAHALFEHRRQILNQDILDRSFLNFEDLDPLEHHELLNGHNVKDRVLHLTRSYPQMESDADRLGLYLMYKAGFDTRAGASFWHKMQFVDAKKRDTKQTHPKDTDRSKALESLDRRLRTEPDLKLSMDSFL